MRYPSPRAQESRAGPWRARRNQAVVATGLLADRRSSSSASAGVFHLSVLRGLVLRAAATAAISSAGRWLIMISDDTKFLPRRRVRALGIRSTRPVRRQAQFATQRASTLDE